jgi:hypothetical protein
MPAINYWFAGITRKRSHCRRLVTSHRLDKIVTAVVVPKAGNPLRSKLRVELTLRG